MLLRKEKKYVATQKKLWGLFVNDVCDKFFGFDAKFRKNLNILSCGWLRLLLALDSLKNSSQDKSLNQEKENYAKGIKGTSGTLRILGIVKDRI